MPLVQQFDSDTSLALSTLGAAAAIVTNSRIDASRRQGFRVTKSKIMMTMSGKTTAEGPILYGVMANISNAADLAAILVNDPQGKTDKDERAPGQFVKLLGVIGLVPTTIPSSDTGIAEMHEFSYGKNGWSIPEGRALSYFAFNQFGSALSDGTILQFTAEHFGVWLND